MAYEFRLPDLGEGIAEAEIRRWLVEVGEQVAEHQAVVEVETDKALVELPSPRAGKVLHLHHAEGGVVEVGAVLLSLEEAGEQAAPERDRPPAFGIVGILPEAVEKEDAQTVPDTAAPPGVQALPAVRALAAELGVDLGRLRGSGPDGAVSADDVRRAAEGAPVVASGGERVPLQGIRRLIARRLGQTQQRTACVTNMDEFDVSRLWELKRRERPHLDQQALHLTFLPFFIKAAQHALLEFPRFNARLDEDRDELVLLSGCHMGIAVDTPDGLMVPVVRDVDKKSIVELAAELQRLSTRAHERSIQREELQGSTFSLTNFGSYGGRFATPILNAPNVAILGCGRIDRRPWVVDDELAIRQVLPLSLTFDHRISDGAEACRFLTRIGRFLEDPGLLFIESV